MPFYLKTYGNSVKHSFSVEENHYFCMLKIPTMATDDINTIKELITEKEGNKVEFKQTTGQLERGMETLCAFLNGEGGTVLFGVADNGKITGRRWATRRNGR